MSGKLPLVGIATKSSRYKRGMGGVVVVTLTSDQNFMCSNSILDNINSRILKFGDM